MALSAADLERARQIAAAAPEFSSEQRDRLRAILSASLQTRKPATAVTDQDGAADAA